jgi:hypothetical protein
MRTISILGTLLVVASGACAFAPNTPEVDDQTEAALKTKPTCGQVCRSVGLASIGRLAVAIRVGRRAPAISNAVSVTPHSLPIPTIPTIPTFATIGTIATILVIADFTTDLTARRFRF